MEDYSDTFFAGTLSTRYNNATDKVKAKETMIKDIKKQYNLNDEQANLVANKIIG